MTLFRQSKTKLCCVHALLRLCPLARLPLGDTASKRRLIFIIPETLRVGSPGAGVIGAPPLQSRTRWSLSSANRAGRRESALGG